MGAGNASQPSYPLRKRVIDLASDGSPSRRYAIQPQLVPELTAPGNLIGARANQGVAPRRLADALRISVRSDDIREQQSPDA